MDTRQLLGSSGWLLCSDAEEKTDYKEWARKERKGEFQGSERKI